MPLESLKNVLARRRTNVDAKGESWESAPAESQADASHLVGLQLGAPPAREWLRTLERTPEEDTLAEALIDALAERGSRPSHAPGPASEEDTARLLELAEALANMQDKFKQEREQLGGAREELARREAELRTREEALEQERERQRQREQAMQDYPVPDWLRKETLEGTMNFGVVGNAGVGKSLLINRIRRIRPHADGWAPVGVNETTMRPTKYTFPNMPKVRIWDLPGAGTEAFPSATYNQTMGLRYFDKVIIVTAGRFTSTEVALKAELERHSVPFLLVRTKVDIDVYNNREDNSLGEKATIALISQDLRQTHEIENPYLVSLRDVQAYDMPALLGELFPGLKRELDPSAPCFEPSAAAWNEPWAIPAALSAAMSGLQGRWCDSYSAVYLIQGSEAHITLREGQNAVVVLQEHNDGKVWWCARWWLNAEMVNKARWNRELRWTALNPQERPLIWWWAD